MPAQTDSDNNQSAWIEILIVVSVVIAITLPFMNKALHIDDYPIVKYGTEFLKHPWRPLNGEIKEFGVRRTFFESMRYPPLVPMFIGLVKVVNGRLSERILHLFFIIFPLSASIFMYFLARYFTKNRLLCTFLFISTPAFVVSSHGLMTEIPMVAFFLGAIVFYIYGIDKNNNKLLFLSSIFLTLAWFTRYRPIILIPILFLHSLLSGKNLKKSFLVCLLPIIFFLGWTIHNMVYWGTPHILGSAHGMFKEQQPLVRIGISTLAYIGGATICPIILIYGFIKGSKNKILFPLSMVFSLPFILNLANDYTGFQKGLLTLFVSAGLFVTSVLLKELLIGLLPEGVAVRDKVRSNSGYILLLLLYIVFLISLVPFGKLGCVRSILILTPPLAIIFVRLTEEYFQKMSKKHFRIVCITGTFLTLITSIFISLSDYEYAGIYRSFPINLRERYKEVKNVYYNGEWGFRYYLDREGYKYLLSTDNTPQDGDIIIIPGLPTFNKLSDKLMQRLHLLESVAYSSNLPIRVMDCKSHAGFYSDTFGLLPYSFSNAKVEHFDIYRVGKSN